MSPVLFAKVVSAIAMSVAAGAGLAEPLALDSRYAAFVKKTHWVDKESYAESVARRSEAYANFSAGLPTVAQLQAGPASDAAALLVRARAADVAATYTKSVAHAFEFRDLALLLERQGAESADLTDRVYEALFSVRAFAEAVAWRESHPQAGLEALPEIIMLPEAQRAGRVVMVPSPHTRSLALKVLDYRKGPFVIVVGYPRDYFSSSAVAAIEKNQAIMQRLGSRIQWMTPQDRNMNIGLLQKWNADHPGAPMAMTYLATSWPDIDAWGTPGFYFFKDGALVNRVKGWPDQGHFPALDRALASIGL